MKRIQFFKNGNILFKRYQVLILNVKLFCTNFLAISQHLYFYLIVFYLCFSKNTLSVKKKNSNS